jgi:hypothetical protein
VQKQEQIMIVDGEHLPRTEVRKLIKFFSDECREYAGQFYDRCQKGLMSDAGRSEKFRAFWREVGFRLGKDPQFCYVETHYQNFAEDVRSMLAGLLARPDVTEFDKARIHKALIVQQILGETSQHTPVQLQKDSQTFAGDWFEVKQTAKNFGNRPDETAIHRLMGSTTIH